MDQISTSKIGEVFDFIQEEYTSKMIRWVPFYQTLMTHYEGGFASGCTPRHILDLGAGNGNVTALLLAQFPQAKFTLVDASGKMLEEAALRFGGFQIETHQDLMQHATFDQESFDLVAASFSLHHLTHQEKKEMVTSIYGWLRPGASFCYADLFIDKEDPEHASFLNYWEAFVRESQVEGDWEYLSEHYHQYDMPTNLTTQIDWLRQLDFKKISITVHEKYWVFIQAEK